MYEMMKLKYREKITDSKSIDTLIELDKILSKLQSILVKEQFYDIPKLIQQIEPLKKIDENLYSILLNDIKMRRLLERSK